MPGRPPWEPDEIAVVKALAKRVAGGELTLAQACAEAVTPQQPTGGRSFHAVRLKMEKMIERITASKAGGSC